MTPSAEDLASALWGVSHDTAPRTVTETVLQSGDALSNPCVVSQLTATATLARGTPGTPGTPREHLTVTKADAVGGASSVDQPARPAWPQSAIVKRILLPPRAAATAKLLRKLQTYDTEAAFYRDIAAPLHRRRAALCTQGGPSSCQSAALYEKGEGVSCQSATLCTKGKKLAPPFHTLCTKGKRCSCRRQAPEEVLAEALPCLLRLEEEVEVVEERGEASAAVAATKQQQQVASAIDPASACRTRLLALTDLRISFPRQSPPGSTGKGAWRAQHGLQEGDADAALVFLATFHAQFLHASNSQIHKFTIVDHIAPFNMCFKMVPTIVI